MEIFMLTAVGITVSVALMINKKREPLHLSFAALCLAIAFHKGGVFFTAFFHGGAWPWVEYLGLLAIPPLTIKFSRDFCGEQTLLKKRDLRTTLLASTGIAAVLFTPAAGWKHLGTFMYLYANTVLLLCYLSLIVYAKKKAAGAEKKRIVYLIIACTAAIATCSIPPLFNLIVAGVLYFVLIMITHPHLTELHDIMTRALVILIVALFTTVFFYLVIGFFGKGPAAPFTLVFMVSFLIIIAIGPFQVILKRLFTTIYPEIKDVFTSPYDLDEKLEREKALLLEKMAPVLAHEIRNPLGSIKGAAQVLRSEVEGEEQRKLLDVITEEVNRLNRVVSQFLDYARPYAPELRPRPINAVIEKAMALVEADGRSAGIHVQLELHPHLPPVPMDQEQIHQVILNIALNAVEAMPEGGTLTIRTSRIESDTGDAVGISVRDTGPGIRREALKQIFTPFFTTRERGVGLGLAVCQRIIRNHGGKIRVKSIPGQGTIFYIRLETVR
ncbi:MAG: ATP-binding protein [Deltaproteobacteria bacterium]|nr:ATP-binding protein [Deltaproteobacteria bacterium]